MTRQFSPEVRDSSIDIDWDGASGQSGASGILHRLDPQDSLGAIARGDAAGTGAAELAVFAWVLGLPAGWDPADAAQRLLTAWPFSGFGESGGERARLLTLLQEIAHYPAARLARLGRRRGGRHGRRGMMHMA